MATQAATVKKSKRQMIEESVPPEIGQIPFSLVDKSNNKTTRLLANSGKSAKIEGQNRWYTYDFISPVFVQRVVVLSTNYPDYRSFELRAETESGEAIVTSNNPASGRVFLEVNDFCKSISFKPPRAYFSGEKTIDCVEIYGFDKAEASNFIQFCRDIENFKSNAISEIERREETHQSIITSAQEATLRINEAAKEITKLKGESDRHKANIKRLDATANELNAKIASLENSIATETRELEEIRSNIDYMSKQKEKLIIDVSTSKDELSELKSNIDLFPSELGSFSKQGAKNIKTLFALSFIPIILIMSMFFLLICGAADLTTRITESSNVNISALIVSRMPYLLISLAIITASYKISRYFIVELININRQRLNLTKISIVAKDISNVAEFGLQLTAEEKYNFRVRLKMDMLRDHLKNYISPDFSPLAPTNVVAGLETLGQLSDSIGSALRRDDKDSGDPKV